MPKKDGSDAKPITPRNSKLHFGVPIKFAKKPRYTNN